MIEIRTPAKINLTLEIIGKRPDGFHEIRSVIQAINLCDRLRFKAATGIDITGDLPGWEPGKSLVSKAATLFKETFEVSAGALITIEKRIPLVAGLGGDSSDAAATLIGLNRLWKTGLSHSQLAVLARQLGSDVTYFLSGGTALMEGRGEIVSSLKPLAKWWVVLAVPPISIKDKTKTLYDSLNACHYTDGERTKAVAQQLNNKKAFSTAQLYNSFEHVAFSVYPGLLDFTERLLEQSAPHVHLAGTGPTIFSIFKAKPDADKLYRRLKEKRIEAYLALTTNTEQHK